MPMPAHMTLTPVGEAPIEGSVTQAGREKTILVNAFIHEVKMPRDPQTGKPTGKRFHDSLTIVKEFDKASPLLFDALCMGKRFTDVTIKFYRIDPTGSEEWYYTVKLEDAIIVNIKAWFPNCLDTAKESFVHMEDISFTYRKIIWTWEPDKIEAEDDWEIPA